MTAGVKTEAVLRGILRAASLYPSPVLCRALRKPAGSGLRSERPSSRRGGLAGGLPEFAETRRFRFAV